MRDAVVVWLQLAVVGVCVGAAFSGLVLWLLYMLDVYAATVLR